MGKTITQTADADGILTLTIDVPGHPVNVLTSQFCRDLAESIEFAALEPAIRGVLITSAKSGFVAGADINELLAACGPEVTSRAGYELSQSLTGVLRRLETLGKPVAVAINGAALGGGLELCLACHYRVLSDNPKATVGLPEVTIGLLPGAGGTQRLPRLIGIPAALPVITQGKPLSPAAALDAGIVHKVAPLADIVQDARTWILSSPDPTQPWDRQKFRIPDHSPPGQGVQPTFLVAAALAAKLTQHNYPAPAAILSAVFEGTTVPIEAGLKIESQYFGQLLTGPVARNLMRTMFVNKGLAERLARRPADVPKSQIATVGVLGAGMMGSGIAYATALAGIDVVLLDSTPELAQKGKAFSAALLAKSLSLGRTDQARADALLERIRPTASYADLSICDLIVEAVFEQRDIKAEVIRKAAATSRPGAVFASNTSTLPISGLAKYSRSPESFIGLHFFSPVEKMPLVEIIVGAKTSQQTLARALDFVGQLRKTPIVVNDSRGFYTSRLFGTFVYEGMRMLEEGIAPALIENGARQAGMAVGPLAVSDEVSLELQFKVIEQAQQDLGERFNKPIAYDVLKHFVVDLKRIGRRCGHGFYEYPADGKKFLWPGLREIYALACRQPSVEEVHKRLLYIQALETTRCFEEGVLTAPEDADLGSILGWGFPAYTGGTLSFIDTVGIQPFVTECFSLADLHGERFRPSPWLLARAHENCAFHSPTSGDRAASFIQSPGLAS